MRLLILYLTIIFTLASCGQGNHNDKKTGNNELGMEIGGATLLTGVNKEIALRICYAYRSKRVSYRSSFLGENFSFSVQNSPCNGEDTNKSFTTTLLGPLISQPMVFDIGNQFMTWFASVQTDENGAINSICEKLISGSSTTNEIEDLNNLTVAEFATNSGRDYYVIFKTQTDSEGKNFVTEKTTFYVQTNNQSAPYVGDDYEVLYEKVCPDGSESDKFEASQVTSSYPINLAQCTAAANTLSNTYTSCKSSNTSASCFTTTFGNLSVRCNTVNDTCYSSCIESNSSSVCNIACY